MLLGCFVDAPVVKDGVSEASSEGLSSTGGSTAASSTDPGTSTGTDVTGSATESGTGVTAESTGAECPPCVEAPGPCRSSEGTCVEGACVYPELDPGTPCDDNDACTTKDICDAGVCAGELVPCDAPNAAGTCADGVCGAWECAANWGNCDGSWENGCEVPVGVANQCDIDGLNPDNGCWTAYCGSAEGEDVHNFGDYYCVECDNCRVPEEGAVQWCSHGNGTWFPPSDGACSARADNAVCVLK